jgi:hypothetical protein
MSVRDQESFDEAMFPLRTYHHKKLATANEVTVNAYYKTPKEAEALESDVELQTPGKGKKKSKGKSKADKARDTVRPTPLGRENSGFEDPDDPFASSSSEPEVTELSSPTPRDSVTNRRLSEKRQRDATTSAVESTRQEIFSNNICTERLCDNKTKCCYIMPKAKTHHIIDIAHQRQWAASVHSKAPGVTTSTPPVDWIAAFAEGDYQTSYKPKLSGTKKLDQTVVETTAKSDSDSSSIENLTRLILIQTMKQMTNQAATSTAISLPLGQSSGGGVGNPGQVNRPDLPANSARNSTSGLSGYGFNPLPSSPIRPANDDENEVGLMGQWMIRKEKNPKKQEELKRSFDILDEAFVTELSHLRDIKFVTSLEIKPGIAYTISDNISAFKEAYKAERLAAQELLKLSGVAGRQQIGMSGEDENCTDFFVEY